MRCAGKGYIFYMSSQRSVFTEIAYGITTYKGRGACHADTYLGEEHVRQEQQAPNPRGRNEYFQRAVRWLAWNGGRGKEK